MVYFTRNIAKRIKRNVAITDWACTHALLVEPFEAVGYVQTFLMLQSNHPNFDREADDALDDILEEWQDTMKRMKQEMRFDKHELRALHPEVYQMNRNLEDIEESMERISDAYKLDWVFRNIQEAPLCVTAYLNLVGPVKK